MTATSTLGSVRRIAWTTGGAFAPRSTLDWLNQANQTGLLSEPHGVPSSAFAPYQRCRQRATQSSGLSAPGTRSSPARPSTGAGRRADDPGPRPNPHPHPPRLPAAARGRRRTPRARRRPCAVLIGVVITERAPGSQLGRVMPFTNALGLVAVPMALERHGLSGPCRRSHGTGMGDRRAVGLDSRYQPDRP